MRAAPALALILVFNTGQVFADEACPRMSPSEIDEQWQKASRPSAQRSDLGDQLECLSSQVGTTPLICRTKPNSSAHPSILLLRILVRGGSIEKRTDGYTAGDCSVFQDLMSKFRSGMTTQEHRTGPGPIFDPVP
jgi:hypothetical protein